MKKMVVFLTMLCLCATAFPVDQQTQPKQYDVQFSLSVGSVKRHTSFAGEFVYARNLGPLFVQGSAMTNFSKGQREYGISTGIGLQAETFQLYVFLDSLYHNKLWSQIRPVAKLDFGWLSAQGFYGLPLNNSPLQIGEQKIAAAKHWGGNFELVVAPQLKLYGNIYSLEDKYHTYRVGAEVRILKWFSVSADWNKSSSEILSNWNSHQNFRIVLNFGAGQDFKKDIREKNGIKIIPPSYPMLTSDVKKDEKPPEKTSDVMEFMYVRVLPIIDPNSPDTKGPNLWSDEFKGLTMPLWTSVGVDKWQVEMQLYYSTKEYHVYVIDGKVGEDASVAEDIYGRIKGTQEWKKLPVSQNGVRLGKWTNFYFDSNGFRTKE